MSANVFIESPKSMKAIDLLSPPAYLESILALPVKERLVALLQPPSIPSQPPTPVTSLIVRLPLSLKAQSSKTFSIRTAVHAITDINILDANIIETNLYEIFIPLTVQDQIQPLLQAAGVLQQPRPPLTAKDLPRRAFSYNRSRHHSMRKATLLGFSPDLQSQLLDLAHNNIHKCPPERQARILRGLQRDRDDISMLLSNRISHGPGPSN